MAGKRSGVPGHKTQVLKHAPLKKMPATPRMKHKGGK